MPKYGFDKTNRVGACVIAEALGFPAEVGQRWSALNIEFSWEASRELDLLDTFQLTNKPYPTGISAGNNVMPKVELQKSRKTERKAKDSEENFFD